ncbi:glycosyltransferase family 4 protein [Bacillus cereus]|uniref:glycosyltransferase family 4 protein n=1 Tax=Bacillus cereus TaxID=1396 RepID=UPI0007ABB3BC|nr:glycosyltransferase family 4 protein [Bacillus cereus]KZD27990.1 Glycosyl transferase group 1 family protein [Bacillus cereus]MCC2396109.1 glycosyltransferase family 4 protein [Bacillus cereus]MCU5657789.1 glycosyltransferase family 4 protein [Bacillus cereus]MCU5719669.1 glycosyltransferase family 4 protein [Bacillus cereus]
MQKVLIVNSFYYPDIRGGAEISTQLLAEGLSKNYEVHVLTTGNQKDNILSEEIKGVKVHRLPCKNIYWPGKIYPRSNAVKCVWHLVNNYNPIQKKMIREMLKEISPSLIHTQNLMGIGTYLWNVAVELNIPVVHTTRDYALIEPVKNKYVNRFIRYFNRKRSLEVNHVVGISRFILEKHQGRSLFSNIPFSTVHNVVSAPRYSRQEIGEGKPLTLGYYGQLEENKGVQFLLNAVKKISPSKVKKVYVCGVGSQEKDLKEAFQSDERIVFKGKLPIEDVYRVMANTDLTIVPSIWEEPFGRVIIESYNQGTPVIASNRGGIPEVLENKEYLFDFQEESDLIGKIENFFTLNKDEREREICKVYKNSSKYHDNIELYINVYKEYI